MINLQDIKEESKRFIHKNILVCCDNTFELNFINLPIFKKNKKTIPGEVKRFKLNKEEYELLLKEFNFQWGNYYGKGMFKTDIGYIELH